MNLRLKAIPYSCAALLLLATLPASAANIYIATDGDDTWSGHLARPNPERNDGPLQTLEAARDAMRTLRTTHSNESHQVVIQSGVYRLNSVLAFGPEDSGTREHPVTWKAAEGAKVVISGAVDVAEFGSVSPAAISKLDPVAREHVLIANLKSLGVTDFGSPEGRGLSLVFRDTQMTLARWPNEGFTPMKQVVGETPIDVRGTKGFKEGRWVYDGDRPSRWIDEQDPWVHGYWFWDWSDQRHSIASIDPDAKQIEVEAPYHGYGYRDGQWYYAYNLLSEIDQPGEWYLDRADGILYFWPPAPPQPGDTFVTTQDQLISVSNASYLEFRGFRLEGARRNAVTVQGGDSVIFDHCTVAHIGDDAVTMSEGTNHRVQNSTFYQLGGGAISMRGGDRPTLTSAGHAAINNHIHHYGMWYRMYKKAISLDGVGLRAANNHIHDAPHMAIGFSGNDHIIEYNGIHDVCLESNDAGAIYAGRDWTMRGTKIRFNYLHDIRGFRNEGAVGVYLDDMFCGTEITDNVFYRVTRAAFIGGGRDVTIANNLFVDCDPALHIDGRALNWASYHVDTTMTDRLKNMPYTSELWKSRYPELVNILSDEPAAPKGNIIERNIAVGGRWNESYAPAPEYVVPANNTVLDAANTSTLLETLDRNHDSAKDFGAVLEEVTLPKDFKPLPLNKIGRSPGN